ncbi:MAG TPA: TVP38/TMEM64 family protein [Gemmatimonadota bacterium]|jgi:uncharacterized membrane protein YdjX (TVP38/TMEM64 family)
MRKAVLLGLVAVAVAAVLLLPVRELLVGFLTWTRGLGAWGPVLVAAAYVPASLLFVPGSILTLGAGFLFGVGVGTVAVSIGSVMGAVAAFLAGRTLARGWVEQKVAANPRLRALDRAVARQGFKIVLLTRLSPIFPFNLLNYAYGASPVAFSDYLLASWIGMIPGTLLYVYLGSAVKSLADLAAGNIHGGPGQKVFFGLGLLATVALTVLVTRIARGALREALSDAEAP